ncbi:hypothetical protein EYS14_13885 [Alteromonadaceae bacterium M269]|nr:hypothetical protein EYS14_13885 [Alteromonadaceae bacterium M269]
MSKIILEGGTDTAEMALFCSDTLPEHLPDSKFVTEMQNRNTLIRLPTGADGGYLLHIYVNESLQEKVLEYCVQEDKLTGEFNTQNGNVSFGGLESTYASFKPNKNIREDGQIERGSYFYSAYRTEFPDEAIEEAIQREIGTRGVKMIGIPGKIALAGVLLTLSTLLAAFTSDYTFFLGAFATITSTMFIYRQYTRTEGFKKIDKLKNDVEKNFPSIIIRLDKKEKI